MESPEAMKEKVEVCPSCGTLNRVPSAARCGGTVRCARCEKDLSREDKVKLYNRELVCDKCAAFLEDIEKVALPEATDGDLAAPQPLRIGGWLIIPAIGLIGSPIGFILRSFAGLMELRLRQSLLPEMDIDIDSGVWIVWFIDLAMIIALLVVAFLFFSHRRIAVWAIIGLLIAAVLKNTVVAPALGMWDAVWALHACVQAGIWIPYFLVSRRVKNTFTE